MLAVAPSLSESHFLSVTFASYNSRMTLLDAKPYNARKAKIRRNIIIGILIVIPIIAAFTWYLWDWPEEHRVNRFFQAVEAKNYTEAFALWNNDPNWQQHPDRYATYSFAQFETDWGPSSDYGVISGHNIVVSLQHGSGVVIGVKVQGSKQPAITDGSQGTLFLWVERKSKTIGFSPVNLRY